MAEIVGIVANLAGAAIELGKCIAKPIKRQFKYLCCFDSNVQNLRDEAQKLDDARVELQRKVTTAENNAEVIVPVVKTWLEKTSEVQAHQIEIESEITKIQNGCLSIKSRFSLSRKVVKIAENMEKLWGSREFYVVSTQPATLAASTPILSGSTCEFESRKSIEEAIMKALRENGVNMVGICGMGGVGKTTMAESVRKRVMEEKLFEETVKVVVSQRVDKLRIQKEMAESLGMRLEEESLSTRAHKIRNRLTGGKRILIVLDDIWKNLELEELGIPCKSDSVGCKILLTSRNKDVLNQMDVQVCEIQTLLPTEAWSLFQGKVGNYGDDQNLFSVARDIVKECKGLPLALVTVGMTLKNKRERYNWEDALQKLKRPSPKNLPAFIEEVYNPLKLSFDSLDDEEAKSIFLLCCLFPEDGRIPISYLAFYAVGLRMFDNIGNLKEARNRTWTLVERLKNHFLLLDGGKNDFEEETYVRLHDVVRDVAIFIASKERRIINCDGCTWISSCHLGERTELTTGPNPDLRLSLIDNSTHKEFKLNDNLFEGNTELTVLSISYNSLRSLPHTTQLLKNLQSLILSSCRSLQSISIVGELLNLEILVCHRCHSIKELPAEVGRLHRLKLLDFSYCSNLKIIRPGVMLSLVGLEELKMVESFDKWEADEDKNRKNVGLKELESLSNLTGLEIGIEDSNLAAEHIRLSPRIEKFSISIGGCGYSSRFEKTMMLHLPREITPGNWIQKCLRSVERLYLKGNGSNNLDLGQAHQNLRSLTLESCSTVKKLVNKTVFPLLEYLWLGSLDNLEEICETDGPITDEGSTTNDAFKNLKELTLSKLPALKLWWKSSPNQNNVAPLFSNLSSIAISGCDSLRNLFSLSSSTANDCLPQLARLGISSCKMMEQVFLWNGEENGKGIRGQESCHIKIIFPMLESLELSDLSNLTTFYKGIEIIKFPHLTHMSIRNCPKLKRFVSTTASIENIQSNSGGAHDHDLDDTFLHLLCHPNKVAFGSLKALQITSPNFSSNTLLRCHQIRNDFFMINGLHELVIGTIDGVRSLFSSLIAKHFLNLRKLQIFSCPKMVNVIEDDEEEKYIHVPEGGETTCLFPNLQQLELQSLPRLKIFCEWRYAFELPSLEEVRISYCPEIERFSPESLTAPKLKTIKVDFEEIIHNTKDLNGVLQQRYLSIVKDEESLCKWEAKIKGIDLSELQSSFFNRETGRLKIEIKDSTLAAEQVSLPSNISEYDITIGDPRDRFSLWWHTKKMNLHLPREITLGNWIHQCVRNAHSLRLEGEGSSNLDLGRARNMESLALGGCSKVTKLVNISTSSYDGRYGTYTVLPASLEFLKLFNLINLEELWEFDGPIPDEGSGSKRVSNIRYLVLQDLPALKYLWKNPYQSVISVWLSSIRIYRCGSLPHLFSFSLSMANNFLPNLHTLEIMDCKMMKQVYLWNEEENGKGIGQESRHVKIIFPNLMTLKLLQLPNLTTFCQGIESIDLFYLTKLEIGYCPKLKSLVSTTSSTGNISKNHLEGERISHDYNDDDDSLHLIWNPKKVGLVSLDELKIHGYGNKSINTLLHCHQIGDDFFMINGLHKLEIWSCGDIRSLFSSSIAENFENLKELQIYFCQEMVEVIEDDEEDKYSHVPGGKTTRLFPRLQKLKLWHLPKLKIFCKWKCAFELPLLEEVSIYCCSEMKRFSLGSLTTPNLKTIRVNYKEIINSTKDLNSALQQNHLLIEKEEESFYEWEAKAKGIEVSQIQSSFINRETDCLKIEIKDSTLAAEQVILPSNILEYDITIGDPQDRFSPVLFGNKMHLDLPRDITLGDWIHQCVRSVHYMRLEGEGSSNLNLGQAQRMRSLIFGGCSTVRKLVNIITSSVEGRYDTYSVFPFLESLELFNLINLKEICDFDGPIPEEAFGSKCISNIKHLKLRDLPALKHLWKNPYQCVVPRWLSSVCIHRCGSLPNLFSFSSSMANHCLSKLKKLEIVECEMMEQVFSWNHEENGDGIGIKIIFPRLERLKLFHLPNLTTFCQGIESLRFPELTILDIECCPKLKSLVSVTSSTGNMNLKNSEGISHCCNDNDEYSHLFCGPNKVSLARLKELRICGYNNMLMLWCHDIPINFFTRLERLDIVRKGGIRSLFSSSTTQNLDNLKELTIDDCEEMVEVIEDDKDQDACQTTICHFPKLQFLHLVSLSKLEIFCKWIYALELPLLERVDISQCPKMKRFSLGSLATPNMKTINIDGEEFVNTTKDLNGAIHQHFFRVEEDREGNEGEDTKEGHKTKGEIEDQES